jgi:non-lysosomal glucosylceramidase
VLQVGAGCLADQLVGQCMAHVCGLGYLLDPAKLKTTLASIIKYNFKTQFFDHFNPMRSYALNDESGLLVATYPKDRRPARPFPYCSEVWTGLEYTAAAGMMYEQMSDDGVRIVAAARDRFDGRKRNPFDEPECGHHYARAMASWATVLAMTGFDYDAVGQHMRFRPALKQSSTWFWSNGDAYGTVHQAPREDRGSIDVTLAVAGGSVRLKRLELSGFGAALINAADGALSAGQQARMVVQRDG